MENSEDRHYQCVVKSSDLALSAARERGQGQCRGDPGSTTVEHQHEIYFEKNFLQERS
jgi:hypothetical protein